MMDVVQGMCVLSRWVARSVRPPTVAPLTATQEPRSSAN